MADSLILKEEKETRIDISDIGYLILRQDDHDGAEREVILSPAQAEKIHAFIEEKLNDQLALWDADNGS